MESAESNEQLWMERQNLILAVQTNILPKYGFEASLLGLLALGEAQCRHFNDPEVWANAVNLNHLLGFQGAWTEMLAKSSECMSCIADSDLSNPPRLTRELVLASQKDQANMFGSRFFQAQLQVCFERHAGASVLAESANSLPKQGRALGSCEDSTIAQEGVQLCGEDAAMKTLKSLSPCLPRLLRSTLDLNQPPVAVHKHEATACECIADCLDDNVHCAWGRTTTPGSDVTSPLVSHKLRYTQLEQVPAEPHP
eukprot:TRINITY_DN23339_c0_g1_i1.p1 TRINITY_DN23339_c0_g1~~TRINITY_DN23339_c0_g1_i1.p1  ORF type:complete len:264 (-),score=30.38 TRINITY_DN23339_c0_g1_i1:10-771(-)